MYKLKLYDRSAIDFDHVLFNDKDLWKLMIPVILEQLLATFMGMMDTMMVSRVGSAAISAVSLVDSINVLFIQVFAALATGGTILCSQYLGAGNRKFSNRAAEQVTLSTLVISTAIMIFGLVTHKWLLRVIFGSVEAEVMADSQVYFLITIVSYPFFALAQAGSAFYRAAGNSRFPMIVSVEANVLNIIGNAILIFGFDMGVAGAAYATTASRIFNFVVIFVALRKEGQPITVRNYRKIRPDWGMIGRVLAVGIPSGIENGMFQFGKLAIQSSVSTLGTTAIAAQAMTAILEALNGIGGMGIGIAMMTVVGQAIGANRKEEAKYYICRMTWFGEIVVLISCGVVWLMTPLVTMLGGMDPAAAAECKFMMNWITVVKPVVWVLAFLPAYGMRAAGDVRFSMIMSSCTMWFCRVVLATVLIRVFGFGPIAVWIGMFADWTLRGILYMIRYFSGKWMSHNLVETAGEAA